MGLDPSSLRGLPLFSDLDAATCARLGLCATTRHVRRNAAVFRQGESADAFFLLLHGRLKVTQVTPAGAQVMVRIVHPGDLFGIVRALGRTDYPGTATAAVDSLLARWPTQAWDGFVSASPGLAMGALRMMGQRLEEAQARIRDMSTEAVERRVAHVVLRLAAQAGAPEAEGVRIDFPLSRRDIAELTGTTLHTVSRILSAWEAKGLVRGGRRTLLVRDRTGLARQADAPAA